jgi:hypothetical protein
MERSWVIDVGSLRSNLQIGQLDEGFGRYLRVMGFYPLSAPPQTRDRKLGVQHLGRQRRLTLFAWPPRPHRRGSGASLWAPACCHLYEPAFMCSHLRIASNRNERMRNHSCLKKTGSIVEVTVPRGEARRCVAKTLEALDLFSDRWQD